MRRRTGVLGLVVALALGALWWCRGSRNDPPRIEHPSGSAALHSTDPRTRAKTATLGGHVTRKRDRAPVADAAVAIRLVGPSPVSVPLVIATTDRDGGWTMAIAPGTYDVAATASALLPEARGRVVIEDDPVVVDLALADGGIEVRGTVSDIGGGPIAGARVEVALVEGTAGVLSRADGTYRLTLAPGTYDLTASHDDYAAGEKHIVLGTGTIVQDFALVPGGTVRGVVVARDTERPIAGAIVRGIGWARSGYRDSAVTDGAGRFMLRGAPAGDLELYANAAGYVTAQPTPVNLGIGEATEVRLVADRGYTIRGRIVRADRPTVGVAGVTVDAHTEGPVPDNDTRVPTGSDGAFEIVGLAPSVYELSASGEDTFDAKRSRVVVEHDLEGITIPIASGIVLRGKIQPATKASIDVSPTSFRNEDPRVGHARATCADDGTFVISNVPPGELTLHASTTTQEGNLELRVGATDQGGLVIALEPDGEKKVRGTAVDETGAPVANADITDDSYNMTRSAADGTFELSLPTGKHRIWAVAGYYDRTARDSAVTLDVTADVSGVVLKVVVSRETIAGRVVATDHTPVADAWVNKNGGSPVLTGADGRFVLTGVGKGPHTLNAESARNDASAKLANVSPGDHVELVLERNRDLHARVTLDGVPVTGFDVRCTGGVFFERHIASPDGTFVVPHTGSQTTGTISCEVATATAEGTGLAAVANDRLAVDIALHPFVTVTGTVVDLLTKQPVTNVIVRVIRGYGYRLLNGTEGQRVGANGRFEIDHVSPGDQPRLAVTSLEGRTIISVPIPAATIELGTITVLAPPEHPGNLGLALGDAMIVGIHVPAEASDLRMGDRIVSVDGVPFSAAPAYLWSDFFSGLANAGQTYAITVARGVTVNVTAQ